MQSSHLPTQYAEPQFPFASPNILISVRGTDLTSAAPIAENQKKKKHQVFPQKKKKKNQNIQEDHVLQFSCKKTN
jgi:hypothetical protein